MKSENINYNPRIDELRGIACLLVFTQHSCLLAFLNQPFGGYGVYIFFILSAFLFTNIFLSKPSVSYTGFIHNRFLRIFPMFSVLLFIIILIFHSQFNKKLILYFLTLCWNIPLSDGTVSNLFRDRFGATWTIAVEFKFYLIFPFLFLLYRKYGLKSILWLWIFSLIVKDISHYLFHFNPYYSFIGNIHLFLDGIILACIANNKSYIKQHNISLIIGLIMTLLSVERMYAIIFTLLIYFYIQREREYFVFHLLRKLGVISYSFYLWHQISINVLLSSPAYLDRLLPNHHFFCMLLVLVITVAVSSITYYCIEKPFMNLRKKY